MHNHACPSCGYIHPDMNSGEEHTRYAMDGCPRYVPGERSCVCRSDQLWPCPYEVQHQTSATATGTGSR